MDGGVEAMIGGMPLYIGYMLLGSMAWCRGKKCTKFYTWMFRVLYTVGSMLPVQRFYGLYHCLL